MRRTASPADGADRGGFGVYLEPGLLASIAPAVDQYADDLRIQGCDLVVTEFAGSTADLRADLQERVPQGLEGALVVGAVPYHEFTSGERSVETYLHDLYFADLDGEYVNAVPVGDVEPEIYVSWITASPLTELVGRSESQLINDYFARAHDADLSAVAPSIGDIVVISSSVVPATVADAFREIETPVILWEGYLFDDMAVSSKGETTRTYREITISDPSHLLAARAAGDARVYTAPHRLSYGTASPDADVVATVPRRPEQATIFAYDRGDSLVDGSIVAGRRVGLFADYAGARDLTPRRLDMCVRPRAGRRPDRRSTTTSLIA